VSRQNAAAARTRPCGRRANVGQPGANVAATWHNSQLCFRGSSWREKPSGGYHCPDSLVST
jgi:hypothetical protein